MDYIIFSNYVFSLLLFIIISVRSVISFILYPIFFSLVYMALIIFNLFLWWIISGWSSIQAHTYYMQVYIYIFFLVAFVVGCCCCCLLISLFFLLPCTCIYLSLSVACPGCLLCALCVCIRSVLAAIYLRHHRLYRALIIQFNHTIECVQRVDFFLFPLIFISFIVVIIIIIFIHFIYIYINI